MSFKGGKQRPELFGLANPLLTKSDGSKMGKTEKGALWVTPERTSPYEFYQYFINVDDADIERLLKFFTMIPLKEISDICKKDIVSAKRTMAFEITKLIHGETEAIQAQLTSQNLFSGNNDGSNAPTETISFNIVSSLRGNNVTEAIYQLADILALTSVIKSKREARELIESGAIQINGVKITDVNHTIPITTKEFLLKKGKKTFVKVILKR